MMNTATTDITDLFTDPVRKKSADPVREKRRKDLH